MPHACPGSMSLIESCSVPPSASPVTTVELAFRPGRRPQSGGSAARLPVMLPYLDALRQDGDALLAAARRDLKAQVPSCPGWDVEMLLGHVARIYSYVAQQARSAERVADDASVPSGDALLDFFAEAHAALLLVLRETPADAPAWNWARNAPDTAAFWPRRMAQETTVHRWDAQSATGSPDPIPTWLACDGVSEMIDVFLAMRRGRAKEEITGTVHLHATDPVDGVPSEWVIVLGPRGATSWHEGHEKGDAALRGSASDLLLATWQRSSAAERFGDSTLLDAIRAE